MFHHWVVAVEQLTLQRRRPSSLTVALVVLQKMDALLEPFEPLARGLVVPKLALATWDTWEVGQHSACISHRVPDTAQLLFPGIL